MRCTDVPPERPYDPSLSFFFIAWYAYIPYTPSTMKRLYAFPVVLLLLTACVQANTGYTLTFDQQGQSHKQELIDTATRVISRRLQQLELELRGKKVEQTADGAVIRFALADTSKRTFLDQQLSASIDFRVMVETTQDKADIWNDQDAIGFRATGITEKNVTWATATPAPVSSVGAAAGNKKGGVVTIALDTEGQKLLAKTIQENEGKRMGIFVRGALVTYKRIATTDKPEAIPIDAVPSYELAIVFADDVNLGAHATFTPLTPAGNQTSSTGASPSSAEPSVSSTGSTTSSVAASSASGAILPSSGTSSSLITNP